MAEEINYLPVEDVQYDKLGFEPKAREIASFINDYPSYLPYSIGLKGSWGSGKSTMLNFIEQHLDKEKCSIIRFNPWMLADNDSLIKNLFEEIYYKLDGGVTNTKQKFVEYAEKVIPSVTKVVTFFEIMSHGMDSRTANLVSSSAGEAVKGVGEKFFDKPLSKRKQELHTAMDLTYRDTEKKIVVMIDELDRLFPDEIITVFQMIKAALDFPGLIFIVAMDETMVYEALEKRGISKPTYYLEKIFQRNYYINIKNQIRTLTNHFLLNYLEETYEPEKKLIDCLEAYIFQNEEKFAVLEPADFKFRLGEDWEWIENEQIDLVSSYYTILPGLVEELNLTNPRTFIKFAAHIRELWPEYYNNMMSDEKDTFRLHAAFLMLISYISYPTETDSNMFRRDEKPAFVKRIGDHFNHLIPRYRSEKDSGVHSVKYLDSIVDDASLFLHHFPDSYKYLMRIDTDQ